ncbi:cuticle protein 16.8-like [Tachypleus tridentatus]|uniref:cuticle protein 16.8-like n=1 Tax=Tachypleus tridentatus TaxID=6853 RepID=UPI003FD29E87
MLGKAVILLCLVAGSLAGYLPAAAPAYEINIPTPYDTGYDTVDEYGTKQSRQESGDGNGRVQGSYGYTDPWGTTRQVKYTADEGGFRAWISTNEAGTANQNPADVEINSQAAAPAPAAPIRPVVKKVVAAPAYAPLPAVPKVAVAAPVLKAPLPFSYPSKYYQGWQ